MKVGDVVGYKFAQGSVDITYLLVTSIDGDTATCWELFDEFLFEAPLAKLWPATERDLDGIVTWSSAGGPGSTTIRDLVNEKKRALKQENV